MALFDQTMERAALAVLADTAALNVSEAKALLESHPLQAADLHVPAHQDVFNALSTLLRRSHPPTLNAIHHELSDSGAYAEAGGYLWLEKLLGAEFAGPDSQWPGYSASLRNLGVRRAVIVAAQRVAQKARDLTTDVAALPGEAAAEFSRLRASQAGLKTLEHDLSDLLDDLQAAQNGKRAVCIKTGITIWDRVLGGLIPGVVTFVGAQPGVGKSALIGRMTINLAKAGIGVGLISLEDSPKWLSRRAVAEDSRIPVRLLATEPLDKDRMHRAGAAVERQWAWHRHVIRQSPERMTPAQVAQCARSMVLNHGAKVVFLDHLGEIDVRTGRRDRHDLDVNEAVSALREVAIDHNIPMVVAAHFHRPRTSDTEPRYQRPSSTSWGESAYIERKARVAVGLWLQRGDRERVVCTVLKQTLGASDLDFWMQFDGLSSLVQSIGGDIEKDDNGEQRLGYDEEAAA